VERHPQSATIKARKSRTANETYLSNGCIRCDALFGQFHVSEAGWGMRRAATVADSPTRIGSPRSASQTPQGL
jgi:hypothetical protein